MLLRPFRTATALALAALAVSAPQASAAACRGADARLDQVSSTRTRAATLCLLNRERRAHHLAALREDRRLRVAGVGHARDMVANRYFAHNSLNGRTFAARILATGYASGHGWFLGENIAWGAGRRGTPRAIVRGWMHSPPHRANVLSGHFKEIGIGIVGGTPAPTAPRGATYVTDFGTER